MGIPKNIDLTLYDVIKNGERRATVVAITPAAIIAKESTDRFQTDAEKRKRIAINREHYADGSSGWERVNLPRVTVSYIGGKNDKTPKRETEEKEPGKGF